MEVRGLANSLPRLLKIGAVAALSCLALGQAPREAQAQTTTPQVPTVQLGVPQLGPAPMFDTPAPFVCWTPGTPVATIVAYNRTHRTADGSAGSSVSPFRVLGGRWSRTATSGPNLQQGQPTTITYSFVDDGVAVPNDFNNPGAGSVPNNLNARFNAIYGSQATWRNLFAQVANSLSAQTGLTIVEEPNDDSAPLGGNAAGQVGVRGDIRVTGRRIDGDGGILAFNFAPDFGEMVIDTADDFFANTGGNSLGFRNVASHELGHGLGLAHTCPIDQTKLMEPFVSGAFDGPQFDDLTGLSRFYGDGSENNDTIATPTNLGTPGEATITRTFLSIDSNTDVDYFQFGAAINKSVSVRVRPIGTPYLEGAQNDDGSCSAGTLFDPTSQSDLGFELLQSRNGGFFSLGTTDANPTGGTETLAPTNVTRSGAFQVRVFANPAAANEDKIQMYAIDVTIGGPVVGATPTPGPTAGPTPTTGPTAGPTPTPGPQPTPIRPIVDLNGANDDGSTGQDSPISNGLDNVSFYDYTLEGELKTQTITPTEAIVLSDISSTPLLPGRTIVEARVELTPDVACFRGQGIAPDNCNIQNKRDNEVLGVTKGVTDFLNNNGTGITSAYNVETQILTFSGANTARYNDDAIRSFYEVALSGVTYLNKLPIPNTPFARLPRFDDRILTYVVDTDNNAANNVDGRFAPQEGPGSNPLQSKVAVLTLKYNPLPPTRFPGTKPNITVTTPRDISDPNDGLTSLREAIVIANKTFTVTNAPRSIPGASIVFFLDGNTDPNYTINLAGPLPILQDGVDVLGLGARRLTVRSVNSDGPIFNVAGTSTISGLTISNGRGVRDTEQMDGFDITTPTRGGGINKLAGGNLTVRSCAITGNFAQQGAGIASRAPGNLTVVSCLVSGNVSSGGNFTTRGGGIFVTGRQGTPPVGPVTDPPTPPTPSVAFITNSTISSNTGGGIGADTADVTVTLSTVPFNTPYGMTSDNDSIITVSNTIVSVNANNQDVSAGVTRFNQPMDDGTPVPQPNPGTFVSGGYNIIGAGNQAASFDAMGDRRGVTSNNILGLDSLSDNGGDTDTHALRANSVAINSGDPAIANAPVNDQRGVGFERVRQGQIDVGAFERQDDSPVFSVVLTPRNPGTNDSVVANLSNREPNTTYNYRFSKTTPPTNDQPNGQTTVVQNGTSATLDLSEDGNGDRGDVITVLVTATNASGSTTASDSVTVVNTLPSFTVTIVPRPNPDAPRPNGPLTNDRIEAVTTVLNPDGTVNPNNTDADGDRVQFSYRWQVNGRDRPQEVGRFLSLSTPGNGDRDEIIVVFVTATDRQPGSSGEVKSAATRVGNSAPVVTNQTLTVPPGRTGSILLRGTDPDSIDSGKLTFTFAAPTGQNTLQTEKGNATITANSDGTFLLTYTANAGATGEDVIRVTATDTTTASSAARSATGSVVIRITDPNRPPAVTNTSLNVKREVLAVKNLAASDPDPDDVYENLTLKIVGNARKGTAEIRRENGIWKLFYKAVALGRGNDEVRYVAVDQKGATSNVGTITINIFNSAPTARSTEMRVAAGGSADVGIFGADADRDELTFQRVGGPTKGTGEFRKDEFGNFRFFYQNSPAATGDDLVRFVAIDESGTPSEIATLNIKVIGFFNRAPVASNVTGTTSQGTPVAVAVAGTDPDEEDVLTFKRVGGPTNGTGEIRKDTADDGTFKMFYTPRADFVGTEVIRYVAIDQKGRPSAPATITIRVTASAPNASALQSGKGKAPSGGSS